MFAIVLPDSAMKRGQHYRSPCSNNVVQSMARSSVIKNVFVLRKLWNDNE